MSWQLQVGRGSRLGSPLAHEESHHPVPQILEYKYSRYGRGAEILSAPRRYFE